MRRLRLKTLDERSDPEKIADDVMRKCKYIPSSSEESSRCWWRTSRIPREGPRASAPERPGREERRRRKETNTSERASIDDVDDYVELLTGE